MDYPDIYYLPEWLSLYARRDGEDYGYYVLQCEHGTVIYPYVRRKVPRLVADKQYYDIITPYGFNGPCIVEYSGKSELLSTFKTEFSAYCEQQDIIAEYVRFSPWLKNYEDFYQLYSIRDNNKTIAIDLSVPDILMDEVKSKRRNEIRKAQKEGVSIHFDFSGKNTTDFRSLYQNTIKKNEIGTYYQFSDSFIQEHFSAIKDKVFIANAEINGRVISSSIFIHHGGNLHYHLSANDYSMMEYQGNSLLLYEVALWGKENGFKYLHLGGAGVAEKSLMDFKMSFSHSDGFPFYIGTKVRNAGVYNALTKMHSDSNTNYFPAYRGEIPCLKK
ncbi:MAG: GNAT family N-acetyltransferase [Oscillospiraceae bacterium]|nr:GNAT family N-acetyltransferase [Oscillospiraceae bacterium]